MQARIQKLLSTPYEESEKLDKKRYEEITGDDTKGLGKILDKKLNPSFNSLAMKAFDINESKKTAKIKDVSELFNLADAIYRSVQIEKNNKRKKKNLLRYTYCLAMICHRNHPAHLAITNLTADKLRDILDKTKIEYKTLQDKFPPSPSAPNILQINTTKVIASPSKGNDNLSAKQSIPPYTPNTYIHTPTYSPGFNDPNSSSSTIKTPQNDSMGNFSPPPMYVNNGLVNTSPPRSEEMKPNAKDIVLAMLKDMHKISSNKTEQKKYFINAIQSPLIHKTLSLEKSNNPTNDLKLGLPVLLTLSQYMDDVQLNIKDDDDDNFNEIRRERLNCLGGGNTNTWQEMRTAVKQEIFDRLKKTTLNNELPAEEYDRYTTVFAQHSGRCYAQGFCGLWAKTNSLKAFEKHFKRAPDSLTQKPDNKPK